MTQRTRINRNEHWAIEYEGYVLTETISFNMRTAKEKFLQRRAPLPWKVFREQGYKTTRIRVNKIKDWGKGK